MIIHSLRKYKCSSIIFYGLYMLQNRQIGCVICVSNNAEYHDNKESDKNSIEKVIL